jgi:hypothetical protein
MARGRAGSRSRPCGEIRKIGVLGERCPAMEGRQACQEREMGDPAKGSVLLSVQGLCHYG